MVIHDDPYFAGQILDKSGKLPGFVSVPPVKGWTRVYIANLIFPAFMGWMVTRDGGRVGMLVGIFAVFSVGYRACFVFRWAVLTVVYGGWIVALAQLAPLLHVFAGIAGVAAARALGEASSNEVGNVNTILGGFIATLVTGGILIAVAWAFGAVIRAIIAWHNGRIRPDGSGRRLAVRFDRWI